METSNKSYILTKVSQGDAGKNTKTDNWPTSRSVLLSNKRALTWSTSRVSNTRLTSQTLLRIYSPEWRCIANPRFFPSKTSYHSHPQLHLFENAMKTSFIFYTSLPVIHFIWHGNQNYPTLTFNPNTKHSPWHTKLAEVATKTHCLSQRSSGLLQWNDIHRETSLYVLTNEQTNCMKQTLYREWLTFRFLSKSPVLIKHELLLPWHTLQPLTKQLHSVRTLFNIILPASGTTKQLPPLRFSTKPSYKILSLIHANCWPPQISRSPIN